VLATNKKGLHILLSMMYGANWLSQREVFWAELRNIHQIHDSTLRFFLGINTTRFTDEKLGGKKLSFAQLEQYNSAINDCVLSDIKSIGSQWS